MDGVVLQEVVGVFEVMAEVEEVFEVMAEVEEVFEATTEEVIREKIILREENPVRNASSVMVIMQPLNVII